MRRPLPLVGLLACAVGVVGAVALGWDFGGSSPPVASALGAAAAVLAVGATVWRVVLN